VVGRAGEQVQRTLDPPELDVLAADLQLAGDQLEVGVIVEVGEQLHLAGDLVVGLDRDEPGQHALSAQHATCGRDESAVEREVVTGCEPPERRMDDRLAGVEVDRRAGDRQRVDMLGTTRGIDRGQPAALAVADQVHGTADVIDCPLDHIEVVVDRRTSESSPPPARAGSLPA
jgi:hypothetical protein